jgi:hypothetical protein
MIFTSVVCVKIKCIYIILHSLIKQYKCKYVTMKKIWLLFDEGTIVKLL